MKNFACLLLAGLSIGLAGCGGSAPPPIEIGHVSDNTRRDKAGEQAERGLRLALNELSKDDALAQAFGGKKVQIRHTDTQGKLEAFESQAVRLESVSRCTALFGGNSLAETVALSNAKVPILTFHGFPAPAAGNNVFYLGMSPRRQGVVLARVVADEVPKVARVVLLADDRSAEAQTFAESFRKTLGDLRGVEPSIGFGKDAKWTEIVERINAIETHTVVFAGSVQDFNAWHRVLRKEGVVQLPQLVFAGADGEQKSFDFEGNDKVSVLLASAFHADPTAEKFKAFLKAFRDEFKTEPDVNAALAYDGLHLLIAAMKETGTQLTPDKLREELLKIKNFDGLTGPLTINADRKVDRPLHVLRWQNGTLKLRKTIAP